MSSHHLPNRGYTIEQPYETVCTCHGDDWLHENFKLEHEAAHYRRLYQEKDQAYHRIYQLLSRYNGSPELMLIRDKDIRRRHRWCSTKDRELQALDVQTQQRVEDVTRREIAVYIREMKQQEKEERYRRQMQNTED